LFPGIITALVLMGAPAYGWYRANAALAQKEGDVAALSAKVSELENTNSELSAALETEQSKNADFESQIKDIGSTVGTLQKVAATDPQFLAKYSKVYFLNENYFPPDLVLIDPKLSYDPSKELYFQGKILPHLEDLLNDAVGNDIDLKILSAYRSFATQQGLKSAYTVSYGAGANRFSADQGYSEHQLGTAVDFTTVALKGGLSGFDKTDAYAWLQKNAYKYGFVLSYPPNNAYYIYEPWHWRYVGVELAERLHDDDKYFYELDQREINTYLVSFFD
jgi:D-alanyl-D-alanine carboxypeptidase